MKKLKFRVWDKLEKRYIYPDQGYQGHYILDLNGKFHNLQNGSGGNEYGIEQFTGVFDKTGKEIYEGDIVRGFMDFGPADFHETNGVISWCDKTHSYQFEYWNLYSLQVIGNTFETPELRFLN